MGWSSSVSSVFTVPAGATSGPRWMVIGPPGDAIPAELVAYYAANYASVPLSAQLEFINDTDYRYTILCTGSAERASGWGVRNTGTGLMEVWEITVESYPNPGVGRGSIIYDTATAGREPIIDYGPSSVVLVESTDYEIDGFDAPRGFIGGQSCAPPGSVTMATSAAIGTEVVVPAATWTGIGQPTYIFQPGRLYRVPLTCNVYASAAGNRARVNLRKTAGFGGALLVSKYVNFTLGAGAVESRDWILYLQNLTAAPISAAIDLTITMIAGGGNVNLFAEVVAASIAPTELGIEDIGSVVSNPGLANAARAV